MAKNKNVFRKLINLGFTAATIYSVLPAAQKAQVKKFIASAPEQFEVIKTKVIDQIRATD